MIVSKPDIKIPRDTQGKGRRAVWVMRTGEVWLTRGGVEQNSIYALFTLITVA